MDRKADIHSKTETNKERLRHIHLFWCHLDGARLGQSTAK